MNKIRVAFSLSTLFIFIQIKAMDENCDESSSASDFEHTQEGYLDIIFNYNSDLASWDSPMTSPRDQSEDSLNGDSEKISDLLLTEQAVLLPQKSKHNNQVYEREKSCISWLMCCLCCAFKKK